MTARAAAVGVALVVALVAAAGLAGRWSGLRDGADTAAIAQAKAENDSLRRLQRRVDTLYLRQRDTVRVRLVRLDTLIQSVELWKHDTTKVVEFVTAADSAARACTAALLSCDERAAVRDQRIAALSRGLAAAERLQDRPWASAGVAYDPRTGRLGAYADRDLWRLRVGGSITPGVKGWEAQLRAGWRW